VQLIARHSLTVIQQQSDTTPSIWVARTLVVYRVRPTDAVCGVRVGNHECWFPASRASIENADPALRILDLLT
jgi:hypothetical protein